MSDGLTALFVHGAGGTHLAWPEATQTFEGVRALAVDLPGHGGSQPPGRRTINDYAMIIERFVEQLALKRLILVGHSMGSAIALTLALRDRVMIDGLILLGAAARMPVGDVLLGGALTSLEQAADFVAEHGFAAPRPEAQEGVRQQILETGAMTTFGDFLACNRFDLRPNLPGITARTLVVAGDHDNLTPLRFARTLASGMPNAHLSIVEGAGHFVMLERPDHVAHLLGEFLAGVRAEQDRD